jgi:phosphatidate cytidylyltransferase
MFLAPNLVWAGLLAIVIGAAAFEWGRLAGFSASGRALFVALVVISCALVLLLGEVMPKAHFEKRLLYPLSLVAVLFWTTLAPAALHFHWPLRGGWIGTIAGWLVLVPAWLAAAHLQHEPLLLLLLLAAVWIADTAAYFTGRRFGKRKLAPRISPGKTIEGVAGAFVAVLIYVTIALRVYMPEAEAPTYVALLVFGFILTALSVEGDLIESWIKRQAGAKDSGDLLPGHGGILDRIDSLTATMPFAVLFFAGILG